MKKTILSALTASLIVGASATTFAAANPFSDVPAGHWAYNSVTKLAQEGVIEGYGDGTFLGQRNITRYEMAQMIAKALAKNPTGANKAELDRLAAEFREELNNLGVRVAELEKHSDMVKWTGEVRYRYWNDREDLSSGGHVKRTSNQLQFRLFPTAEINDHWTAKARLTATDNMSTDTTTDVKLTYIYAEGDYDKFNVKLGRMALWSDADEGLTVDDFFSGASITYGDKFKVKVEGGRWSNFEDPANYQGGELLYDDGNRFNIGVAYRHFNSDSLPSTSYGTSDDANVISVGAGYKFGEDWRLSAAYANNHEADDYENAYNFELNYKGADKKVPQSWGAYVAYRYVGENVSFMPTYDTYGMTSNKKGIDFGLSWSPLKNTYTQVSYFHGKTLDSKETTKTFFGRVSWFF